MRLRRSPDVTYEIVDGKALLVDAAGRELIRLNAVGTLVWSALDGGRDVASLADHLLPRLEGVTRAQLVEDIEAFLGELRGEGLVVEADAAR